MAENETPKTVTLSAEEWAEIQNMKREFQSVKAGVGAFQEESAAGLEMMLDDVIKRDVEKVFAGRRPQAIPLILSDHGGHMEMLRGLLREDRAIRVKGDDETNPKRIMCSEEDGSKKRPKSRYELQIELMAELAGPVDPRLDPTYKNVMLSDGGEPTPEQRQAALTGTPTPAAPAANPPQKTLALSEDAALVAKTWEERKKAGGEGALFTVSSNVHDAAFMNLVAQKAAAAEIR